MSVSASAAMPATGRHQRRDQKLPPRCALSAEVHRVPSGHRHPPVARVGHAALVGESQGHRPESRDGEAGQETVSARPRSGTREPEGLGGGADEHRQRPGVRRESRTGRGLQRECSRARQAARGSAAQARGRRARAPEAIARPRAPADQMFMVLIAVLSLLVVAIGIAGILVTHRVAGPIYKMKRLLGYVGEGHLRLTEKLRKGDELQHFFDSFEKMVESLRHRQEVEIGKLDHAIRQLQDQVPEEQLASLRSLRQEMRRRTRDIARPVRDRLVAEPRRPLRLEHAPRVFDSGRGRVA